MVGRADDLDATAELGSVVHQALEGPDVGHPLRGEAVQGDAEIEGCGHG
jgi:hypothetical protein